jgi:hypothetical protein
MLQEPAVEESLNSVSKIGCQGDLANWPIFAGKILALFESLLIKSFAINQPTSCVDLGSSVVSVSGGGPGHQTEVAGIVVASLIGCLPHQSGGIAKVNGLVVDNDPK